MVSKWFQCRCDHLSCSGCGSSWEKLLELILVPGLLVKKAGSVGKRWLEMVGSSVFCCFFGSCGCDDCGC